MPLTPPVMNATLPFTSLIVACLLGFGIVIGGLQHKPLCYATRGHAAESVWCGATEVTSHSASEAVRNGS
jgi:hypothetical protein